MSHVCNFCNKSYSSYQSLWNHNKTYHVTEKKIARQLKDPYYYCDKCNGKFVNKYTLQSHKKLNKCSIIQQPNQQIQHQTQQNISLINNDEVKLKLRLVDVELKKLEIEKSKIDNEKLKIEMEKSKIEIEKIKEEKEFLKLKLNNKISTNSNCNNSIKNINNLLNSNNTNSNNNITNNFNICALGFENILETLTLAEKKEIIKAKFSCLETATNIINCGKHNEFKNIILTNIKDEYAYKYDRKEKKFICGNKDEIMSDFIDERLDNIKEIFEELDETNKIDQQTKKLIQDFFNQMDDESKYTDQTSGKTWKNFRAYKEHKVKILIYNNGDKITKDLAIILGEPDIEPDITDKNKNIIEPLNV